MRALVAGNWKMNPATLAEARALAAAIRDGAGQAEAGQGSADLLICPPFTALAAVADILRGSPIALGAQDCHPDPAGAHTGDISAAMLRDLGVTHVILGHSERRSDHGEFDDIIRRKTVAAMHAGLIPIVCVGETQDQRLSGQECEVVGWQLEGSLPRDFDGVIAYEPVWAIGTGRTATEADVQTMHAFIAEELRRQFGEKSRAWPILYGGSVRPANARALLHLPNVAGALVGGASLTAEAFLAIAGKE